MDSDLTFAELALAAPLQKALQLKNYTTPSPIQAQAIPHILQGEDMMGVAQTGTGKTAAFALPILHHLHEQPKPLMRKTARALILAPTRELAEQLCKSFREYGKHLRLTIERVVGGVGFGPQIAAMRRGVDVLVATPGRLLDLRNQGVVDFSKVEFFVLDEADRMLDMGFIHDIRKVVAELPPQRQSLFFSATVSEPIMELAGTILTDPVQVRIAPERTTAEKVDHKVCFLHRDDRYALLENLLTAQRECAEEPLTIVFSRTKYGADKLAKQLHRNGIRSESIHGDKTQAARRRALENFRDGKCPVLVATDVAARGIDVKGVGMVVNFDLPDEPESYVHRIGRTARAGSAGLAVSFCADDRVKELLEIEKLLKSPIAVEPNHAYHCERTQEIYDRRRNGKGGRNSGQGSRPKGKGKSFSAGGPRNFRPKRKFGQQRSGQRQPSMSHG